MIECIGVSNTTQFGGAELVLLRLLSALRNDHRRVRLSVGRVGRIVSAAQGCRIPVERVPMGVPLQRWRGLGSIAWSRNDHLFLEWARRQTSALFVTSEMREVCLLAQDPDTAARTIPIVHSLPAYWLTRCLRFGRWCRCLQKCGHVIVVGRFMSTALGLDGWGRCSVMYVGPNARLSGPTKGYSVPTSSFVLLLSRLEPNKGIREAVEAVRRVRRVRPNVGMVVAGSGSLSGWLQRQADVHRWLTVTGYVEDPSDLLAHASCLLIASRDRGEGIPGVLYEAAAAKLPVVSTRLPGVLELNEHFGLDVTFAASPQAADLGAAVALVLGREACEAEPEHQRLGEILRSSSEALFADVLEGVAAGYRRVNGLSNHSPSG